MIYLPYAAFVFCVMRNITNSAGLTGATPMTQISLPLSISFWLIVVVPMSTKNASPSEPPANAPALHKSPKNSSIVLFTRSQSKGSFGSKTTQFVLTRMDCSINKNNLLTLTYLHKLLELTVLAPHMRMPCPGKLRMRLTPFGFNISCSPVV